MKVKALVMAGGKGTRMGIDEKPLVKIRGEPMIKLVLNALIKARSVEEVIVLTSRYTPKTTRVVKEMKLPRVKVMESPGAGFVEDIRYAIRNLGPEVYLVVSADLPLITPSLIDFIVERYEKCGRSSLAVMIPTYVYELLGLKPSYVFKVGERSVVPSGINLIDGSKLREEELDEEYLVIAHEGLAMNVNRPEDISVCEKFLSEREQIQRASFSWICEELRKLLAEAVRRNLGEAVLLSGGLDSSVVAYLASKLTKVEAITVLVKSNCAKDREYASLMAKFLNMEHHIIEVSIDEVLRHIPRVIEIMRTFDPMQVRNDVVIYLGLTRAKSLGFSSIMTGDGADELFAGYSYLCGMDEERRELELRVLWAAMNFSSITLGNHIGIEVKTPYLDKRIRYFAMLIKPEHRVREERGVTWGKWILRKAFEDVLPQEIVWRIKSPIEEGAGTNVLTKYFDEVIDDQEFQESICKIMEKDSVVIRDKEQLYYYRVFRSIFGPPKDIGGVGKECPQCRARIPKGFTYCRVCGAYPV
ncbi:MAG: hypothetical protein DRJ40_09730 [Thermoprotei archaeon]|nr:MAG: hypothetical protein DRJ40_09730 [Thermoprotei archaeon]